MHRSLRRIAALVLAAVLGTAAPAARAAVPPTMSYQGVLTDASGTLVPDNDYAMTFRLYDVAAGGAALWTESWPAVSVKSGVFSVLLGGTTPLTLAFDRPLYLGVEVGGDPEMSPRVPLASAPYALGLRLPYAESVNSASAAFRISNPGTGAAVEVDSRLDIGNPGRSGSVQVFQAGSTAATALIQALSSFGTQILLRDEGGTNTITLQPDVNAGGGGFLNVLRSDSPLSGFTVDGNYNGTQSTRVQISGSSSAVFDMSEVGDAAVALPPNAVASGEMLDEPGIASIDESVAQSLTGGISTVVSRSITVPAAGYVVAIGSFTAEMGHTSGVSSRIIGGVSTNSLAFTSITRVPWVDSAAPTGEYRFPLSVQEVFTVAPGTTTVYLLAQEVSTVGFATDASLTLMYFPSSYGTVSEPQGLVTAPGTEPRRGPRTEGELAAERAQHERATLDRIQRQIDALRATAPAPSVNVSDR